MRGDRELGEEQETWQDCCCMWQRGLELPVSEGYREERENLEK